MHIKSFLKLVEIQTKIASFLPYIFGVVFTLYYFDTLNIVNIIIFLISLLSFDMFTTALNNYKDFKKAIKREGYNYEVHNAIGQFNLKENTVLTIIVILFIIAIFFGFLTFLRSDYILLLLGALSFLMGILYSAGPVPISRTCFGEVFSGLFMGFFIPLLVIYVSLYDQKPIKLSLNETTFSVVLNWNILLPILLSSLPAVFCIANIMLANNICDVDDDFENRRYTLPIQIGKKKSLFLFSTLYILSFIDIVICVILGYLPVISLITLISSFKVFKNVKEFYRLQTKRDTFAFSVMNLVIIMVPLNLSLLAGYIINLL
ncbi:MAG: 1,4-dihydroxy-2-naphthoate polyprenyltransferase [Clostridiaceae bacterium]|nr:1,4-dihydroxy-2-naphthoate polyprenyltransferase [Clostridiaceae bacterium]